MTQRLTAAPGSYLKAGFGEEAGSGAAATGAGPGAGLAFSGAAFSSAAAVGPAAPDAGSSFGAGAAFPSFLDTGFCEAMVVKSQQVNGQQMKP